MSEPVIQAVDLTTDTVLARTVEMARTWRSRLRGLIGRSGLEPKTALHIEPCRQIHTFFMSFPIDAIFVDSEDRVVGVAHDLAPWRMSSYHPKAKAVVELPAGTAASAGVEVGHQLRIGPPPPDQPP
jgi:hypothetical protein